MEKIDFESLKKFLLTLEADDFRNETKIKKCSCQNEIEYFEKNFNKKHMSSIDKIIIKNGGYFLVDVLGNDLTIVKSTRRGYKLPNGRVVNCKVIHTVINDCHNIYGTALNGYWAIPNEFYYD